MGSEFTNGKKSFICSFCEKIFTVKSNLTRHVQGTHQDDSGFICDQCQKVFQRKDSLLRHMKTHEKDREKLPAELRSDTDISNVVLYECQLCEIAFSSNRDLLHHTRTEHGPIIYDGDRKAYYECSECSVRVTCKKDIKRHIYNVHSSDRQNSSNKKMTTLRCTICGDIYRTRSSIMDHYEEVHRIKLEFKQLQFQSLDDFEKWISPCYALHTMWVTSLYNVRRYRCHRSGLYLDKYQKENRRRLRHPKMAGSKKIQGVCPGDMTMRQRHADGLCVVTQQTVHVGHAADELDELKHVYLREEDKLNMVRLVKGAGVPPEAILRNVYCAYEPSDSAYRPLEALPRLDEDEYRLGWRERQTAHPKVTRGQAKLRQRHACALREPFSVERSAEGAWQVGLTNGDSQGVIEIFAVEKCDRTDVCRRDTCELYCQPCRSCVHDFRCSCPDYCDKRNMCLHLHALCMFVQSQDEVTDVVTLSVSQVEPETKNVPVRSAEVESRTSDDSVSAEVEQNVHNKIDEACRNLAEMLKSYIRPEDSQLYGQIEQQVLQPVEPTIQAIMEVIEN